jgi:hypothetical protein
MTKGGRGARSYQVFHQFLPLIHTALSKLRISPSKGDLENKTYAGQASNFEMYEGLPSLYIL